MKIDRTDLPTIELGDSDQLQVGDAVIAIGNALGISDGSGPTVTTGIVSGLDRRVEVGQNPAGDFEVLNNAIQTDAAINPGNSGGPLLDTRGRVVGINTAIASPDSSNNVGFAIAISSAKPVIEQLRKGQTAKIAFMGVQTQTVTPSLAKSENLTGDPGALVTVVEPGTAADKAGVKKGDVIVDVGGSKITRTQEVARAVRRHSPGDTIDVVVERDGKKMTLHVTLGDAPGTQ